MTIWDYQRLISRRLIQWALFSLGVGALLSGGRRFWRGVGMQFIGWALVNLGVAWFGIRTSESRRALLPNPLASVVVRREAHKLRRLLSIGAVLDLLYVSSGRWLIQRGSRGTGVGIVVQASFLFLFDLLHAADVPDASEDD